VKQTTSDWLGSLTQRALKDLVCLLFCLDESVDPNYSKPEVWTLFRELRNHVDDEYHSLKGRVPFG
jgi:hypothetical protein